MSRQEKKRDAEAKPVKSVVQFKFQVLFPLADFYPNIRGSFIFSEINKNNIIKIVFLKNIDKHGKFSGCNFRCLHDI